MTMPVHQWLYPARLLSITDGDTITVKLDMGLRITRDERIRLLGIDTPELRGESRAAGLAATEFVRQWMVMAASSVFDWELLIATTKADSFGRWLGDVHRVGDGANLSQDLLAAGHGVVWARGTSRGGV